MATAPISRDYDNGQYRYQPLIAGSRHTRLLTIQAKNGDESDAAPLQGSLSTADLDTKPVFSALSYAWGEQKSKSPPIVLDGCSLSVSENCESALRHLRAKLGRYTIWVDAICINQANETEKTDQVSLMQNIYADATRVYVWLGNGTEATDRAAACLDHVGLGTYVFENGLPDAKVLPPLPRLRNAVILSLRILTARFRYFSHVLHDSKNCPAPPPILHLHEFQRTHAVSFKEIQEFLDTAWIERIWTYQEVMLASKPVLVRGHAHLPWDRFALSIILLNHYNYRPKAKNDNMYDASSTEGWTKLVFDRDKFRALHRTRVLPYLPQQANSTTDKQNLPPLHCYQKFLTNVISLVATARVVFATIGIFGGCLSLALCAASAIVHTFSPFLDPAYFAIAPVMSLLGFVIVLRTRHVADEIWTPASQHLASTLSEANTYNDLVYTLCQRAATESRDYNIGVRGLLQSILRKQLPTISAAVPLPEVFQDLTIQTLWATRSATVLTVAAATHVAGRPSWTPNWSVKFSQIDWAIGYRGPEECMPHRFGATRGSSMSMHFVGPKRQILRIRARSVYTVTEIFDFSPTGESYAETDRASHLNNIQNLIHMSRSRYPFWKTYADEKVQLSDMPRDWWGRLTRLCQFLRKHSREQPDRLLDRMKTSCSRTILGSVRPNREDVERQHSTTEIFATFTAVTNAFCHVKGKFFCATLAAPSSPGDSLKGHIPSLTLIDSRLSEISLISSLPEGQEIGFAMTRIQIGDQVFLLSGSYRPLILRAAEERSYRLVSPTLGLEKLMTGYWWDEKVNYPYIHII